MIVMARKHHEMKPSHVYAWATLCLLFSMGSMALLLIIGS